ncbi:MAG: outer membrane protein assembly factor BamE [Alphaproteobacteria bacterium]|nr:outer membrane protein assembly factor BamE [Alphaproteobacteria bacterium]
MRASRLAPLAMAVLIAACSPVVDSRGSLPEAEDLDKIKVGASTKDEVATLLGSPSAVATFDPNTWYYISKRTETVAFFRPEVLDQKVLTVRFDEAGLVREVVHTGKEAAENIDPVSRTTPTSGQTFSIFQQLFGNIGRFGDTAPRRNRARVPGGS